MGKGFILFERERLIPNFEEDMHVLMNSLHCTKILVLMPPENIYISKFWCLLLYLDELEGMCYGFMLFEGECLTPSFEEDTHVLMKSR